MRFKHAKSLNYDNFMDLHAKIIIFGKTRDMFFIHLEYQPRGNCTLHKLHYRMCSKIAMQDGNRKRVLPSFLITSWVLSLVIVDKDSYKYRRNTPTPSSIYSWFLKPLSYYTHDFRPKIVSGSLFLTQNKLFPI